MKACTNPRVEKVRIGDGFTLQLTFTNGEERVFDAEPYLDTGVFRQLRDPRAFAQVRPFLGSVAWPGGQDFCPDTLYEESVPLQSASSRKRARKTTVGQRHSDRR